MLLISQDIFPIILHTNDIPHPKWFRKCLFWTGQPEAPPDEATDISDAPFEVIFSVGAEGEVADVLFWFGRVYIYIWIIWL